jgi:predicted  nucleic acid-binding Zn-ribbon protein
MEHLSISQKLDALIKLQTIDSQLDEIKKVRGDLPEEVRDLEDELAGYETRISKHKAEIERQEEIIKNLKESAKESSKLIKKYEEQQKNVRNNREFDAISKEVELQQLEIQITEKKVKEAGFQITARQEEIVKTEAVLEDRHKDLANKKGELDEIIKETNEEEEKHNKEREKAAKGIEERLLKSYNKLRNNAVNGLAVVSVKRDACGGCFNTVPPQRQADIRDKKKLIVCEHCGRILANVEATFAEVRK